MDKEMNIHKHFLFLFSCLFVCFLCVIVTSVRSEQSLQQFFVVL